MPYDGGISDYIGDNFARFINGLEQLSGNAPMEMRVRGQNQAAGQGTSYTIATPGFQDIVQLGPRPTVTRQDWAAYFKELRTGTPARLDPALRAEIDRKIAVRQRIENSPTPEWAQAFGQVLTALDNVQDLTSTLAVAGRIVLSPLLRVLPALGIPILALTGVADVLAVLTVLGVLATPLYGLICDTPAKALAAGVPAFVMALGPKGIVNRLNSLNIFGREADRIVTSKWRFGTAAVTTRKIEGAAQITTALQRLAERKLHYTDVLQALQVTRDFFGWGIIFGGIVGSVNDTVYGVEAATRGEQVRIRTPGSTAYYHTLLGDLVADAPTQLLLDARSACGVLIRAPWLLRGDSPMDDGDLVMLLAAEHAALEWIASACQHRNIGHAIEVMLNDTWTPPVFALYDTLEGMEGDLEKADALRARWPLPSAPHYLTGDEYMLIGSERVGEDLAARLAANQTNPVNAFGLALMRAIQEKAWVTLTGDPTVIEEHEPDWLAFGEAVADAGVLVNVHDDHDAILQAYDAYKAIRADTGRTRWPARDTIRLLIDNGVTPIPMLPPDAPLPRALADRLPQRL